MKAWIEAPGEQAGVRGGGLPRPKAERTKARALSTHGRARGASAPRGFENGSKPSRIPPPALIENPIDLCSALFNGDSPRSQLIAYVCRWDLFQETSSNHSFSRSTRYGRTSSASSNENKKRVVGRAGLGFYFLAGGAGR